MRCAVCFLPSFSTLLTSWVTTGAAVDRVDVERPLRGGALARHQLFSFFAPYRLRACLRFFTPWVSSEPRMIL